MKTIKTLLCALFAILMFSASNCSKKSLPSEIVEPEDTTTMEKPYCEYCSEDLDALVAELPWLKKFVDVYKGAVIEGNGYHIRIHLCTYRDGIGFLMEMCVDCLDSGYSFKSWEGKTLCLVDGWGGSCTEYDINFTTQELIWEIYRSIPSAICN